MSKPEDENNGINITEFPRLQGIGKKKDRRNTCGDCVFFKLTDVAQGACHGNPPNALLIPTNTGQHQAISFYPPVHSTELACRHFKDKRVLV